MKYLFKGSSLPLLALLIICVTASITDTTEFYTTETGFRLYY